ncbi:MAG: LysR family transcriptional regulator [Pseudomonadota bacterium]
MSASDSRPVVAPAPPPALLFEMLRSFVVLSETLNLSHAVQKLGSTRQTVRRHIASLEETKGGALFDVQDRRYVLSALGTQILPEAHRLVAGAAAWYTGNSGLVNGLQFINQANLDGWYFYQQQHPISRAFTSSGEMLQKVLKGWTEAGGQLEHPALREVRRFCNIFRRFNDDLIFAEVGEDSSFVSWFGETTAQSSVGRALGQMPGGNDFGRLVDIAYEEVEATQSIRLDHVHTLLPFGDSGNNLPISYERLMLGARFPDQSLAIVSAVRRTYDIEIKGVSRAMLQSMPAKMEMS